MSFFSMFNPSYLGRLHERRESLHSGGVPFDVIDCVTELRTLDVDMSHLNPKEKENFLVYLSSLITASPELETFKFDIALVSKYVRGHGFPMFVPIPHLDWNVMASCPKLKIIHCRLADDCDASTLGEIIYLCKSLEQLSIVCADARDFYYEPTCWHRDPVPNREFEPIYSAMKNHPMLKSFILLGKEGGRGNGCLHLPTLILDLPNLESIEFKRLSFPAHHCKRITAAVEAHDNLKRFEIDTEYIGTQKETSFEDFLLDCRLDLTEKETESIGIHKEGSFDDCLLDRIVNKLAINRANTMLSDNPTFRNWVVTLTAFRHYPAVVDYLIYKGVPGSGGAILLADGALEGLKAQEKKKDEEQELGKRIQRCRRSQITNTPHTKLPDPFHR
ncbi:expressed unknown protein [Seminavis robusta]|uniref:Uncharacterized protein n=1 Tax=Seminavis robusta TaxID=568900 RepID=A0A9N8DT17_9STRA|nr:expressed unknown protein [Seminavis robusta]|eukprot:Sro350_g123730.1 n/a (389) ;mRNA; f:41515-42681